MARVVVFSLLLVVMAIMGSDAWAQGKDPFRPPAGADEGPRLDQPAPVPPAVEPMPSEDDPSDALARTGQDAGLQLALGVALAAVGGGLRLAERAVAARRTGARVTATG